MPYTDTPNATERPDLVAARRPALRHSRFFRPSSLLRLSARLCFWATVILTPVRYRFDLLVRPVGTIYGDYTDLLLFLCDITLVSMLSLWLIQKAISREKIHLTPFFMTIPMFALVVISGISSIFSIDPLLSLYHTVRLLLLTGFSLYIIDQAGDLVSVAIPVGIQIAIQAVVGIGQFMNQSDMGLQRLGEYLLAPEWSGVSILLVGEQRWLRAYGLSDHPNILGGVLVFALILLLGTFVNRENQSSPFVTVAFSMGVVALYLTFSRSAWLAFAVGVVFVLVGYLVRRNRLLVTSVMQPLIAGFLVLLPFLMSYEGLVQTRVPPQAGDDDIETEARSLSERALLNDAGIQIFVDNPILGTGIGTMPQAIYKAFPVFPHPIDYQPAHLALIDAAAETGLLGATIYTILLAAPWIVFILRADFRESPEALVVMALLATAAVIGFLDYYTWLLVPGRLWQYLSWGIWASVYTRITRQASA